jgi:hypothetical protein
MDTAYWTLELSVSNFKQECIDMLENIWLYNIGFGSWFALRLILDIYENGEIEQDDLIQITCALAKRKLRDSTIFHLLIRGAITPLEWKPTFPHSKEYTNLRDAVEDCLRRGKLNEAWLLGRGMTVDEQLSMLDNLASELGRKEPLDIIKELRPCIYETLAACYVLVNLDEITWISSQGKLENTIPIEVQDKLQEWQNETSLRNRRVLKPKPEALLYLTARSEQTPYVSSEPDIQLELENTLQKSEFWSYILEHYKTNNVWKSDDHKESFYQTYFPDDIPDEWSLASREMSHGRGLGKTLENSRSRFIYNTLQRSKSLELWNSKFNSDLDCTMDWNTLYSVKPVFQLPMKPIIKNLVILTNSSQEEPCHNG